MATIFDNVLEPFDPVKQAQQYQTLFNSQLAGQGQQIANDTNQTALQQQKYANLQRLIAGHLADPNATKGDVMDSIQRGLKLGLYTPQQASQAAGLVGKLDDTPNAIHQHLAKGLATLIDAQTALQNTMPTDGPTIQQGSTTTYTQRSPLFSANPGQINPIISSQQGLSPAEMADTSPVTVNAPTGKMNPDGSPEVLVQTMPKNQAIQQGLVAPNLVTPPAPAFGPSGRNSLGAQPPAGTYRGAPVPGAPNTIPPPVGSMTPGRPLPSGQPVSNNGPMANAPTAPSTAIRGGVGNEAMPSYNDQTGQAYKPGDLITRSGLPPKYDPQTGTPLAGFTQHPSAFTRPANQDALVAAGTQAKAANDLKYSSDEYKNNIQGGYTALNVLDSPDMRTGTGQQRISNALGVLTRLGIPINQNLVNVNDQLAHSLAQILPGGGTDAARIVAGLASGSPETSIEALKGLVRANMANRLTGQYAHNVNKDSQPQDYIDKTNRTSNSIDQRVIVAHLINDPAQRSKYVRSLTQGMSPANAVQFVKDFNAKYNALDHGALGIESGTPAPLPR